MSLKQTLAKLALLVVLEFGAVCGVPMTPKQIADLLQLMNRTEVVEVERMDDDVDPEA